MSPAVLAAIALVLGLLAGGLVNACVLRTRDGLRFTFGRRKCVSCARPMAFADHVPVVSFVNLRGRCRNCTAVMPWQYVGVEIAMGVLFALVALRAFAGFGAPEFVALAPWYAEPLALFLRDAIMAMLLVPIFMFDYRASIIPDRLSVPAVAIAFLMNAALGASITGML